MKYNKKDWAEVVIMFLFLIVAVIVLGAAGALMGELIFRLLG
jgi:hypothetical protein